MNTTKVSPLGTNKEIRKKSTRCEDNPCSVMGSWNVK